MNENNFFCVFSARNERKIETFCPKAGGTRTHLCLLLNSMSCSWVDSEEYSVSEDVIE